MSDRTIDLNADLGEGSAHEEAVMPYISSANIACGGHAGDAATMRESLRLSAVYGVAAGAHPSFPDREGFGRRPMTLSAGEVTIVVREQIEALKEVAVDVGATIRHVKPHGMLYSMAAADPALSLAIMRAVAAAGIRLYYGLAGADPAVQREAASLDLTLVAEGFADRGYAAGGALWPRTQAGALLPAHEAVAQGLEIALHGQVTAVTGEAVAVPARTLCLHGDGAEATAVARDLRAALNAAGVRVAAPEL